MSKLLPRSRLSTLRKKQPKTLTENIFSLLCVKRFLDNWFLSFRRGLGPRASKWFLPQPGGGNKKTENVEFRVRSSPATQCEWAKHVNGTLFGFLSSSSSWAARDFSSPSPMVSPQLTGHLLCKPVHRFVLICLLHVHYEPVRCTSNRHSPRHLIFHLLPVLFRIRFFVCVDPHRNRVRNGIYMKIASRGISFRSGRRMARRWMQYCEHE